MAFVESPLDRIKSVTLGLAAHKSGPNVAAGLFMGALAQFLNGSVGPRYVLLTGAIWTSTIGVYAISDEVASRIQERRRQQSSYWFLEPAEAPPGIE